MLQGKQRLETCAEAFFFADLALNIVELYIIPGPAVYDIGKNDTDLSLKSAMSRICISCLVTVILKEKGVKQERGRLLSFNQQ